MYSNDVTIIACIHSDLMYLLIIALTSFMLSKFSFIFNTFGMSSELRVCSK